MKSATVRQLRHAIGSVLAWVEDGEEVEIKKRGKVIARLAPPRPPKSRKVKWPDVLGRLRDIYGNRMLSAEKAADSLAASRGER